MKPLILIPALIVTASASFAAGPDRFEIRLERAFIESRSDAVPGDPTLFNRPSPHLPVENPAQTKRRLRLEILGPFADFTPHPATEFGARFSRIAGREAALGFGAVRSDFEAALRDLRSWLDKNATR